MNSITKGFCFIIIVLSLFLNLSFCQNSYAASKDANVKTDYEILIGKNDYQGALAIVRPLADKGDTKAMRTLGIMYGNAFGVEKDYKEAFKWFKKAAEKRDGISQYMVGLLYKDGTGVTRDLNEGIVWLRKASDNGNASATHELGTLYYEGEGVEKNYDIAFNLFVKAAEGLEFDAFSDIGSMYSNGIGVTRDLVKGATYLYVAVLGGSEKAKSNLQNVMNYMSKSQIAEADKKSEAIRKEIVECAKSGKPLKLNISKTGKSSSYSNKQKTSGGISCNDPIVEGMVIDRAIRSWGSDMAQMGMSRNMLSVKNIRTRKQTKKSCKCAADIIVEAGSLRKAKPIEYTVEMTDDGNPYVTVYGF